MMQQIRWSHATVVSDERKEMRIDGKIKSFGNLWWRGKFRNQKSFYSQQPAWWIILAVVSFTSFHCSRQENFSLHLIWLRFHETSAQVATSEVNLFNFPFQYAWSSITHRQATRCCIIRRRTFSVLLRFSSLSTKNLSPQMLTRIFLSPKSAVNRSRKSGSWVGSEGFLLFSIDFSSELFVLKKVAVRQESISIHGSPGGCGEKKNFSAFFRLRMRRHKRFIAPQTGLRWTVSLRRFSADARLHSYSKYQFNSMIYDSLESSTLSRCAGRSLCAST